MKHSLSGSFSCIYSLCSVSLSSSALDIRPWYASIFSSLLEGDPRKSGVVVMAVKLTSSSILHHTHFTLIHSPPHSLTYMESHGCMLSFTPSHTQLTQASISIQPTKPFSLSKLSPTYGILPKKCHVALSPLHTQTAPLRRVA